MDLALEISALLQVLIIDLSLAGDNAIVIGMAAAGLPADQRKRAMWIGLASAVVFRIVLALFAVKLLHVTGLVLAGGLLLLWVSWKMYRELMHMRKVNAKHEEKDATAHAVVQPKKLSQAITQILVADVGMSLDNILAVAGAAREHIWVMVIGLVLSVALMGAAATATARMLHRWPWMAWIGLFVVLFVAIRMIWEGTHQIVETIAP